MEIKQIIIISDFPKEKERLHYDIIKQIDLDSFLDKCYIKYLEKNNAEKQNNGTK